MEKIALRKPFFLTEELDLRNVENSLVLDLLYRIDLLKKREILNKEFQLRAEINIKEDMMINLVKDILNKNIHNNKK